MNLPLPATASFWARLLLWAAPVGLLPSCSSDAGRETAVALPTGHYEGTVAYQGTELAAVLELRETIPGQLEADMRFPQDEGLSFPADDARYAAPQLLFEQTGITGGMQVSAVREGDFLRGVFTLDSIRTDFVWVRRGKAQPRPYQLDTLQVPASRLALLVLVPTDTLGRHPAIALFADDTHQGAARLRADQLARQGFVTTVVSVAAGTPADSVALQAAAATLQALRRHSAVDALRVGMWARGAAALVAVPAATLAKPRAAFMVLENVPVTSADDARPLQQLAQRRVPVLGLYAAADTSLNVKDSARRLRNAVGYRRATQVRIFPKANAQFVLPGRTSADGKWTWPAAAPGYFTAIEDWLK
ncbi:hypothetical protein [Hymenobacter sp. BT190]|uniref:hypothetical protein n=1 Tax=Hymenobacter sp. BT190 TaxID=2763505 RepID=UPI00165178BB|nr:hypothetical protein [Hymenobacter sp. BT190]MBC6697082.1 hypothetical protein [Hymenobacter sp. BT190]